MRAEHWALMGLTAALLGLLLWFSLTVRQGTRRYRVLQRIVWAALLLWIRGCLGGVGFSGVSMGTVTILGLPGYAVISLLRRL